jgi:hypothetical protein
MTTQNSLAQSEPGSKNMGVMQRWVLSIAFCMAALGLSSCGGGGGSSSGMTPPSALSYQSPQTYTVNSAIPSLSPSITGTVTSYAVSPALPPGLTLNASSGVISGTPTQTSTEASYSITASNSAGSTKGTLSITVDPGIAYASTYYSFTNGVTSQTIRPSVTGAAGALWSVAPALPSGLTLNTMSGDISGTPGAASAATQYVITAKTSGGQSSVTLTLAVAAGPLLDLGHANSVYSVHLVGSSLLTQDSVAHWVLWNYGTGQSVANGTTSTIGNPSGSGVIPLPADLEGSTVVVQSDAGLEVLSATDGSVEAQIPGTPSWWRLATDGSYIATGSATGVTVYSPTGAVVLTHPGNYQNALVFATPTQLQIALGAAGTSLIETIAVPSGADSVGASFLGTFQSWFVDGSSFLTATGTTVWIYPENYTSQNDFKGPVSLPTVTPLIIEPGEQGLGGTGNWFWTMIDGSLSIYQVGVTGTDPTPSYAQGSATNATGVMMATPTTLGFLTAYIDGSGTLTVIDLSNSSTVSAANYTAPVDELTAYGASSSSTWVAGNNFGVVYDGASVGGTPRYLDYGAVTAVSGSPGVFAVATASNRILWFSATNNTLQGTISQPASNVQLSTNGTVLAAATSGSGGFDDFPYLGQNVIDIYPLPSSTPNASFTPPGYLYNMSLSGSGTVLSEFEGTGQVIAVPAGTTLLSVPSISPSLGNLLLSADGTGVAVAPAFDIQNEQDGGNYTTNIYTDYTLATALPGIVQGWLSPTTVLVASYTYNGSMAVQADVYVSSSIYNVSGNLISSVSLPDTGPVQTVSSTLVYSLNLNAMYSLAAGATGIATWSSGSPVVYQVLHNTTCIGGVAGSEVVFPSGNLLLAEPYQ